MGGVRGWGTWVRGHVHGRWGMCAGGHAWRGRGMHGKWGMCDKGGMHGMHAPPVGYYEIWSVNARAVSTLLECILVSKFPLNT